MSRLRVLYDHQTFSQQAWGGISRMYGELIQRFERDPELEVRLALSGCTNVEVRKCETYARTSRQWSPLQVAAIRVGNNVGLDLAYKFNSEASLAAIRKGDFDVFHPTYYDPYFLPAIGDRPFYLIIHDMIHELFPEHFSLDFKTPRWKRALAEKAARIVCVSESTKRDVLRFYGIPSETVDVVYPGTAFNQTIGKPTDAPRDLPDQYVLYVGSRRIYKNFLLFAEAMAMVMKEHPGLKLVCAGGGPLRPGERDYLSALGIVDNVLQFSVTDASLSQMYARARAFVFPTQYEGFGLPILEAMGCGCPAVLSDVSSLPEVGGNAAAYFPPKDPFTMAETIARVVSDDELRARMSEAGKRRAAEFTWDRTARETKRIYQEMV